MNAVYLCRLCDSDRDFFPPTRPWASHSSQAGADPNAPPHDEGAWLELLAAAAADDDGDDIEMGDALDTIEDIGDDDDGHDSDVSDASLSDRDAQSGMFHLPLPHLNAFSSANRPSVLGIIDLEGLDEQDSEQANNLDLLPAGFDAVELQNVLEYNEVDDLASAAEQIAFDEFDDDTDGSAVPERHTLTCLDSPIPMPSISGLNNTILPGPS